MATRIDLETLHQEICRCIDETNSGTAIQPIGFEDGDWWRIKPGGQVPFETVPKDPRLQVTAERALGGRVSVFQLHYPAFAKRADDDSLRGDDAMPGLWVTWRDNWTKTAKRTEFRMVSAGWTLFFGHREDKAKTQILRAEWDKQESDVATPQGQPHWHIDAIMGVGDFAYGGSPGADQDADYGCDEGPYRAIGIHRAHLGMGGWNNKFKNQNVGWYRSCNNDWREIQRWASAAFKCLQEQLAPGRQEIARFRKQV